MKKTIERIGIMTTKKRTTKRTTINKKKTNKKTNAKKKTTRKKTPAAVKKPSWATDLVNNIKKILHLNTQTVKGLLDIATAVKMLAESNQRTLQAINVIADSVSAAANKNVTMKPVASLVSKTDAPTPQTKANVTTEIKTKAQTTAMKDLVTNAVNEDTAEIETKEVTKEQVKQALQEVSSKFGLPKVHELLKEYGSANVTGIKETDYPNFYKACVDMTAPNATA